MNQGSFGGSLGRSLGRSFGFIIISQTCFSLRYFSILSVLVLFFSSLSCFSLHLSSLFFFVLLSCFGAFLFFCCFGAFLFFCLHLLLLLSLCCFSFDFVFFLLFTLSYPYHLLSFLFFSNHAFLPGLVLQNNRVARQSSVG